MKIVATIIVLLCINSMAFGHGMSEEDQIRAAEGGFLDFFPLGAMHMLTGYDHLLFLFGVVFFLSRFMDVVKFVTAFTVGHSITLIFATFLKINVNYFLIDAVIGLSVCYVGFNNVGGFKKYLNIQAPSLIKAVFLLGLIHGFGLSTRLQQLTIGEGWPLLGKIISFNIGVEVGQIAALAVILFLLSAWRRTESFTRFSYASNTALIVLGGVLCIMQLHGFQHETDPSAFAFDEDSHSHVHQKAVLAATPEAQELPPGWHIDPGETVPHSHDEAAMLPAGDRIDSGETVSLAFDDDGQLREGWHIDPGETVPHSHGEEANLPEGWHIDPGETIPHTHVEEAKPPAGTHVHEGSTVPHDDHD